MAKWQDIKGPVVGSTVYADGKQVARDVSFTLPGLEFVTADVQAMGTMSVALIGLLEHMELTITKVGIDEGLSRLNRLEKQNLEFRWVQNVVNSDGSQSAEGLKAFIKTMPGNLGEIGVEVGSASEIENTYGVSRMQVYANGSEILLVDRLNHILKINGKDYMKNINNLL